MGKSEVDLSDLLEALQKLSEQLEIISDQIATLQSGDEK
jgi:prefoldin subunit 5